jgi:flagellar protein FlgJ
MSIPLKKGDNALTAPTTPGKVLPVVDKSKVDPRVREAAEQWEGMFLDYMMKVMRQTVPKNDMSLDSPATDIYRGMQDSETAQRIARAGGVGLADQIIAYLEAQRYTQGQGQGVPSNSPARDTSQPAAHTGGAPK